MRLGRQGSRDITRVGAHDGSGSPGEFGALRSHEGHEVGVSSPAVWKTADWWTMPAKLVEAIVLKAGAVVRVEYSELRGLAWFGFGDGESGLAFS